MMSKSKAVEDTSKAKAVEDPKSPEYTGFFQNYINLTENYPDKSNDDIMNSLFSLNIHFMINKCNIYIKKEDFYKNLMIMH